MRRYKKKFQHEWMSTDHKPKGKMRRFIEKSNRHFNKRLVEQELEEYDEERSDGDGNTSSGQDQ